MTTFKISLISGLAIASVVTSLVIQRRTQVKLREGENTLRQQETQLAERAGEQRRLADLMAHSNNASTNDQTSELLKLRAQVEAVRTQTNELGKQLAENPRRQSPRTVSKPTSHPPEYYEQLHRMAGSKPIDVRNLATAFHMYASDHQGQFPSNLDQIASYLHKDMSLSGATEFDIVYQGSLDELKNIPLSSVALIRGRQTWVGPSGKMMRVYGLADGSSQIVESDDNFQSWEAEHIIPPPAAARSSPISPSPNSPR